ncbi:hypothetical protein A6A04_02425 [Paramagnetospirillum marisnigri]|uniref:Flagellar FliJ protein n=1 Tax=Paramagnetospirillum marisnigri TaxID=1285242 RepID=A0A178MQG1_9PROT|nr:flagellar FliJ family protein [Paramagnetospirillum marisnigri]OAN50277.1 hypothetical protein A6A04_02425 [Paramagnetospirillum marisnigri]
MAAKGLKTLIRLSKWNVDEKQRILVALQGREDEILDMIRREEEQLKEEQRLASEDSTGIGFAYGNYANAWLNRRQQLFNALEAVREEIIRARDALAEAFNELKTYEITQRERERRAQAERDKKEQNFMDEIGLNLYRRKGREES